MSHLPQLAKKCLPILSATDAGMPKLTGAVNFCTQGNCPTTSWTPATGLEQRDHLPLYDSQSSDASSILRPDRRCAQTGMFCLFPTANCMFLEQDSRAEPLLNVWTPESICPSTHVEFGRAYLLDEFSSRQIYLIDGHPGMLRLPLVMLASARLIKFCPSTALLSQNSVFPTLTLRGACMHAVDDASQLQSLSSQLI
jgi:hypothetical protein